MPQVILVNEKDEVIGEMEKMEAHKTGSLHRAFSIFIFNSHGDMLLQQRADEKYHSAGLWTNACCSHPQPGDDILDAARNRLNEEMGFTTTIRKAFHFIYETEFENGLTEYEYDHVFIGKHDGPVNPDVHEVKSWEYVPMPEVKKLLADQPQRFTSWFRIAFPKLENYLATS